MDSFDKVLDRVETALAILAGLLLLFVTLSISISIALRVLKMNAPLWSVQFNEYSLLWITFLGSAWLLRRNRHVSLDIVSCRLQTRGQERLKVIHAVMGLLVCGSLTWISGMVSWDHFQRNIMDVRAVDVPKYLILAVMAVGFFLLTLEFLSGMLRSIGRLREDK